MSYDNDREDEQLQQQRSSGPRTLHQSQTRSALPQGAILLNPEEVYQLFNRTMKNWEPSRDMWPLKYGSLVLGGLASVSGAMFIMHFRHRMLLRNHAKLASLIPTVFLPGLTTAVAQHSFVTNRLLNAEGKATLCPVCAELRSISLQLVLGIAQPFVLSILVSSSIAKSTASYPLPQLTDWKNLMRLYAKLSVPLRSTAYLLVAASIINSAFIVYNEGKAVTRLHARLTESNVYVS